MLTAGEFEQRQECGRRAGALLHRHQGLTPVPGWCRAGPLLRMITGASGTAGSPEEVRILDIFVASVGTVAEIILAFVALLYVKRRQTMDMYDRRLPVYRAVHRFREAVRANTYPELSDIAEFNRATAEASMLFGPVAEGYIGELRGKGCRLWVIQEIQDGPNPAAAHVEEQQDLSSWIEKNRPHNAFPEMRLGG